MAEGSWEYIAQVFEDPSQEEIGLCEHLLTAKHQLVTFVTLVVTGNSGLFFKW